MLIIKLKICLRQYIHKQRRTVSFIASSLLAHTYVFLYAALIMRASASINQKPIKLPYKCVNIKRGIKHFFLIILFIAHTMFNITKIRANKR